MDENREDDGVEESSSMADFSHNIPHMIMSGNLKDGAKEAYHACLPRFCTLRITRLELLDSNPPPTIVFTIGMERTRKTMTSIPIDLKPNDERIFSLDFCFAFQYLHNVKPPFDNLRITIQDKKKKKRPEKTLGVAFVNLNQIMQKALENDDIVLMTPQAKKKKLERKSEEKKDSRQTKEKDSKKEDKEKELDHMETSKKPFAQITVNVALYPEEVDSYQDAQEWDEEFMDTLYGEPSEAKVISSDEEEYESEESHSEDEDFMPQSPVMVKDQNTPQPLSEMMRVRYNVGSSAGKKQKGPSKLNMLKYQLKKINKKNPKTTGLIEEEEDEIFPKEEHSLGSSSASSEEEEFFSPPDSPPVKHISNPIAIRSPVGSLSNETPPGSPTVKSFEKNFTVSTEDSVLVILVDTSKRRGRKMEELLQNAPLFKGKIIGTKNGNEVAPFLTSLVTKHHQQSDAETDPNTVVPVRVVICGGDTYVNYVLRPYVEICSKKPRGWQAFSFYVLPIGKKNDIAMHIASADPTYRQVFFTDDWREELLDKQEELTDGNGNFTTVLTITDEKRSFVARVRRYLDEATGRYEFQIAEALLSFPHSTNSNSPAVQKNIPFIKGMQLGTKDAPDDPETPDKVEKADTTDLQLDYWYSKKKGEGHKEVKSFSFAAITRLPSVANALHIDPEYKPTATTFSMQVVIKDKSKMEKMKEALQHFGKSKKKEDDLILNAKINRLTCSSSADNVEFRALIDGVEWPGVTFVSISPQWHSHVKSFPVQIFPIKRQ